MNYNNDYHHLNRNNDEKTLQIVRAFDRSLIIEIPTDDAQTLEIKLNTAVAALKIEMAGSSRMSE